MIIKKLTLLCVKQWTVINEIKKHKSAAVAEMGDCGHNRNGPKRGGDCCAPFAGELGPCVTQCGVGRAPLPYQVAFSSIQPFGHNKHGPKRGVLLCPFCGGAGSLCNTMWRGPSSTSISSGVFIHPAIWPQ